ncbi:Uncharacterised protein [Mycobacteroides abscessus subsp. abscessus]|nr:Uncharacterised protein [Mycobacteroides abscessus subsp. abscessus]
MNRYVIDGIIADAARGKRVLVAARHPVEVRAAFQLVAEAAHEEPDVRISRVNGRERIDFYTGSIKFVATTTRGLRGYSADVVVERGLTTDELYPLCEIAELHVRW